MARCLCRMRQFFVDDAGECSCMRLMTFLVLLFVLALWAWGCFMAGTYIPLGYAEAGIVSSAIAGKAVQARFEYGLSGNNTPTTCTGESPAAGDSAAGLAEAAPPSPRKGEGGRND